MSRKWLLLASVIAVAILLIVVQSMMQGMLYPAPRFQVGKPPAGFTEVSLEWNPGQTCVAWFKPVAGANAGPTIVYFHGNGENLETLKRGGLLDKLGGLGFPLLAVDYPGYGRSTGDSNERNILQAADAAVRWAVEQDSSQGWIAAGWSLGAATAVQAAASNPAQLKALFVMSGWSSLRDAAAYHYSGWIARLVVKEEYDSVFAAARIHRPALLIHGEEDNLIPAALGSRLASSFSAAKWVALPGTGHNDLFSNPQVWKEITDFLKKFRPAAAD